MTLSFKAAAPFHWFGVDYAAGDTVDTTGLDARGVTRLLRSAPVYVSDGGGGDGGGEPTLVTLMGGVHNAASGEFILFQVGGLVVTDGVTVADSPTLTSETGAFTNALVGCPVDDWYWDQAIPQGTMVLSVESPTSLTMSASATDDGDGDQVVFGAVVHLPAPAEGATVTVLRAAETLASGDDGFGAPLLVTPESGTIGGLSSVPLNVQGRVLDLIGDGTDWQIKLLTPATTLAAGDSGDNSVQQPDSGHATGNNSAAFGASTSSGYHAFSSGDAIASGNLAHAESGGTASGDSSHAESAGHAGGNFSHAEGQSEALGSDAHSEGNAHASGDFSHAEGFSGTATGKSAHAEGWATTAAAQAGHAEGWYTQANGFASHAVGAATVAWGPWMWALSNGVYADGERSQYCFYVPYGQTSDATPTPLGTLTPNGDSTPSNSPPDLLALTLPDFKTTALIEARVVARRTDVPGTASAWNVSLLIDGDDSGSYRIVGAPVKSVIVQDAAAATWDVSLDLDEGGALVVSATGEAGKVISWTCTLKIYEIAA